MGTTKDEEMDILHIIRIKVITINIQQEEIVVLKILALILAQHVLRTLLEVGIMDKVILEIMDITFLL